MFFIGLFFLFLNALMLLMNDKVKLTYSAKLARLDQGGYRRLRREEKKG